MSHLGNRRRSHRWTALNVVLALLTLASVEILNKSISLCGSNFEFHCCYWETRLD
jgi:hypothetical protein